MRDPRLAAVCVRYADVVFRTLDGNGKNGNVHPNGQPASRIIIETVAPGGDQPGDDRRFCRIATGESRLRLRRRLMDP